MHYLKLFTVRAFESIPFLVDYLLDAALNRLLELLHLCNFLMEDLFVFEQVIGYGRLTILATDPALC